MYNITPFPANIDVLTFNEVAKLTYTYIRDEFFNTIALAKVLYYGVIYTLYIYTISVGALRLPRGTQFGRDLENAD